MSRGIGPVLLTHFTPDEIDEIGADEPALGATPIQGDTQPGVLVAPAPTGRSARHRAGRGRRALVLAKQSTASSTAGASAGAGDTSELPRLDQGWWRSTRLLMIIALTGGAVVLAGFGLGAANSTREVSGAPLAVPGSVSGMQPGTLPAAALSGAPTTTVAPPPTTPVAATTTHHAPSTHTAAPPPPSGQNPSPNNPALPEPGQSCSSPGEFTIDAEYQPVECVVDPTSGAAAWQGFSGGR